MSPVTDQDVGFMVETIFQQAIKLLDQGPRIDNDSVADDADRSLLENPGRNRMEYVLVVTHQHGMSGVRSTLVANHDVGFSGENVDDLPLALISPLQPYHATVLFGLDLIRNDHLCLSAGLVAVTCYSFKLLPASPRFAAPQVEASRCESSAQNHQKEK